MPGAGLLGVEPLKNVSVCVSGPGQGTKTLTCTRRRQDLSCLYRPAVP